MSFISCLLLRPFCMWAHRLGCPQETSGFLLTLPVIKLLAKVWGQGVEFPFVGEWLKTHSFYVNFTVVLFPCALSGIKHQAWLAFSFKNVSCSLLFVTVPGLLGLGFCYQRTKSFIKNRAACLGFEWVGDINFSPDYLESLGKNCNRVNFISATYFQFCSFISG